MTINRFEDLIAWQKARQLVAAVYQAAGQGPNFTSSWSSPRAPVPRSAHSSMWHWIAATSPSRTSTRSLPLPKRWPKSWAACEHPCSDSASGLSQASSPSCWPTRPSRATSAATSYIGRHEPDILSHLELVVNTVSMEEALQQQQQQQQQHEAEA